VPLVVLFYAAVLLPALLSFSGTAPRAGVNWWT
jgi:hypothetical protein